MFGGSSSADIFSGVKETIQDIVHNVEDEEKVDYKGFESLDSASLNVSTIETQKTLDQPTSSRSVTYLNKNKRQANVRGALGYN